MLSIAASTQLIATAVAIVITITIAIAVAVAVAVTLERPTTVHQTGRRRKLFFAKYGC
jgi:hypothetical protein